MADRKATLTAVLVDSVSGPAKKIQAEITGIGETAGRVSNILTGIGQGIGQALFHGFETGIRFLSDAIPKLLEQGNSYLEQLHQIQLETGMTAEQTSTLVGALRSLGVPTESLDTLFSRLGLNIGKNEGLFRQLGVATRATDGSLLNSYVIFQNIRQAVQAHGESLLSTAAAQELFGRSGYKLIEALQTSDGAWAAATDNVRRWGGVVTQAAIAGADRFHDSLSSLAQGITDVGVQIASAVDPYLRAFVDSFAKFVQSHLNEIVNFAVAVVNAITGFISGLFGITSALEVTSGNVETSTTKAAGATDNFGKVLKTAGAGADAFTQSINAQIKAIDAHAQALQAAAEKRRATQERQRLADSLHAAQAQLADLQGNAPFLGGLSSAEQALAVQKHAQDIIDAEKNVQDQRQAIGNFEADQKDRAEAELLNREKQRLQDSLAAHKATNAEILQSGLRMGTGLDKGLGTVLGNIGIKTQEFGKTAAASFQTGIDAAHGFIDILLGVQSGPHIPGHPIDRTGGVAGALSQLGGLISAFAGFIGSTFIPAWNAVWDAIHFVEDALNNIEGALNGAGRAIHEWIQGIIDNVGRLVPDARSLGLPTFHFASGGVLGPGWNLVGEQGPELLGPNGRVYPAGQTAQMLGGGEGHGHDLYLDGKKVGEAISKRFAFDLNHSPVTSLPNGSF